MTADLGRIAHSVRVCPAVAGLHAGPFGTTATRLPGGRLIGIAMRDAPGAAPQIAVGVIGCYPASIAEIDAQVRAAVAQHAPGVAVIVTVEDLHVPGDDPQPAARSELTEGRFGDGGGSP